MLKTEQPEIEAAGREVDIKSKIMSRRVIKKLLLLLMFACSGFALYVFYVSNQSNAISASWKSLVNNMNIEEPHLVHTEVPGHRDQENRYNNQNFQRKQYINQQKSANYRKNDLPGEMLERKNRPNEYENYKDRFNKGPQDTNYDYGEDQNSAKIINNFNDEENEDLDANLKPNENLDDDVNNQQDVDYENERNDAMNDQRQQDSPKLDKVPDEIHAGHLAEVPEHYVVRDPDGAVVQEKLFDGGINHIMKKKTRNKPGQRQNQRRVGEIRPGLQGRNGHRYNGIDNRKKIPRMDDTDNQVIDLDIDLNSKVSKLKGDISDDRKGFNENDQDYDGQRHENQNLPAVDVQPNQDPRVYGLNRNRLAAVGQIQQGRRNQVGIDQVSNRRRAQIPAIPVPENKGRADQKPGEFLEAFGTKNSFDDDPKPTPPERQSLLKRKNASSKVDSKDGRDIGAVPQDQTEDTLFPQQQELEQGGNNQNGALGENKQSEIIENNNQRQLVDPDVQIKANKIKEALMKLPPQFLEAFNRKQQQMQGLGLRDDGKKDSELHQPLQQPLDEQQPKNLSNHVAQQSIDKEQKAPPSVVKRGKVLVEDLRVPLPVQINCIPFKFVVKSALLCIHKAEKDTEVSAKISNEGIYEPEIMDQCNEILIQDPSLNFVDIGAGIGVYTLAAALLNRQVVAVEPLYRNYRLLHKSALENSVSSKITLVTQALDTEPYVGQMVYSQDGGYSNVTIVRLSQGMEQDAANIVQVTTLDSLLEVVPFQKALMKLDVNGGMEENVLLSGKSFFEVVNIPYIITHWKQSTNPSKYVSLANTLSQLGYQPKLSWNGAEVNSQYLQNDCGFLVWRKQ